jgi:cell division protein FtsB
MGLLLMIIALMLAMPAIALGFFGMMNMNGVSMVVAIVAIAVFGGVLREFVKNRKDLKGAAQKDLAEIKQRIAHIEADIADIKEQIADFIIKQV